MPNWTEPQKNAIYATGGTLLVSAAAGSGKTSVLVQRIIGRITDEKHPCDIDELLVVTFSRLAAAEMRERLSNELGKRLAENPFDGNLHRQQRLLQRASIGTIDSFCNSVVKNNFQRLDISPDYRICDDGELKLIKSDAMSEVMERAYSEGGDAFLSLVEQFGDRRGDQKLENVIDRIYEYSTAYPFPEKVIDSFNEMYFSETEAGDTVWGREIRKNICDRLKYMEDLTRRAASICSSDEKLSEKYLPAFNADIDCFKKLQVYAAGADWDELSGCLASVSLERLGPVRGYTGDPAKETASAIRKTVSSQLKKLKTMIPASQAEYEDDLRALRPVIKCLTGIVRDFSDTMMRIKRSRSAYSFSDIEHFALELLCEIKDGAPGPSKTARELSEKYREILIDEYQDTNECQDMLFSCLSKNETNMFMVGDVKQSIYRFRKAMPQIFLSRRARYRPYDGGNYPGVIILGENFRSRRGVTDFVNSVFSQIMSPEAGDIEYDESEELKPAAAYEEKGSPDAEVCYVVSDGEDMKRYEAEANVAAAKIRDMVNSGFKVTDRSTGKLRDVEYGDFCIILRKMAGGCGKAYSDALERAGIPFSAGFSDGFFNSVEVSTMICVLTAVDNVLNDVELAGAMASPVFGFSADELASIRIRRKDAPLYTAVKSCADNGDEKCSSFLKLLEQFRRKAAVSPAHMLIRYIYDVTGYLYAVSAMENGVHRRANLLLLLEYASSFERTGQRGLSSFVRYISRLMENGEDLNASTAGSAGQNSVKLMTIHKSKGLEFPVCILGCLCAQTGGGKNKTEDIILLHPELGIGMKRRDEELHNTFDTIQMSALRSRIAQDSISEEMRCLYVAMTRAREHLICMIETGSVEKMAVQLSAKMAGGRELSPFFIRSCKSYGEWITASVMRRREAADVFPYLADGETVTSESPVEITLAEPQIQETTHEDAICDAEPDGELMEELRKKIESGYRYEGLSWIEAKKSASDFTMHGQERAYFAMKKPSFANTDGVPAAERGTAMHKFMQLCDYKRLREDVESEIMRLMDMGALTEREAGSVDRFSAQSFADSILMERIINSPSVMREKSFTVLLDARFLYGPEAPEGEEILIQGAADVVFEEDGGIVIADYKTDRIRDEQKLTGMYRKQLEIYGAAFEKITGLKVKEKLIYSFFLNRELLV